MLSRCEETWRRGCLLVKHSSLPAARCKFVRLATLLCLFLSILAFLSFCYIHCFPCYLPLIRLRREGTNPPAKPFTYHFMQKMYRDMLNFVYSLKLAVVAILDISSGNPGKVNKYFSR